MTTNPRKPRHECFAVCAPGLEALLGAELDGLGVRRGRSERGGVAFAATTRQLYAANLFLRTATRVLVRAASFPASSFAELQQQARRVDWSPWLDARGRVALRASATASRLYHTGAIVERLAEILPGTVEAARGDEAEPAGEAAVEAQAVLARLDHDRATISIDASGAPLFRRGWRQATAKAPLRETLAAAMILASGWDGETPLLDPLCGSGTVAIEAALLARGIAPGIGRSFACQRWPSFEPGTWASVRGQAAQGRPDRPLVVVAADRDPGAVRAAQENAQRAGVADAVTVLCRPLSETAPPPPVGTPPAGDRAGWLISNPPYGVRVQAGGELRELYETLGRVARDARCSVGLLVADPRLAARTGLRFATAFRTSNGGIPVRFLVARR